MTEKGEITTNIDDNIGTIAFYHPKGNSMPGALLRRLAKAITEMGNKECVNVIVLKSRGEGAFCAGASFDELTSIDNYEQGKKFFMGFALVLNAIRKCPKLMIVRVQGKAVGGGVGIAACGDYTIAHESAAIKLSELTLGIGPFVVAPAIERKIGTAALSTLSVNANSWNNAAWACDKGLFSKICSTHEELDKEVHSLSEQLSGYSPEAMEELKKMLWKDTDHWEELLEERAEISGQLVLSDFTKNFLREFKSRNS